MSISSQIRVGDEQIEADSIRAYEIAAGMLQEAEELIRETRRLGLRDREVERLRDRAGAANGRLSDRIGLIAQHGREAEKLGIANPLQRAIDETDYQTGRK